jgi:hypothetical protein
MDRWEFGDLHCDDFVQAFARHREAAEQRGRIEGAEIMREAALAVVHCGCETDCEFDEAGRKIYNLDPAAILAQHTRTKEDTHVHTGMADPGASGALGLGRDGLVLKPLGDSDGDDGA